MGALCALSLAACQGNKPAVDAAELVQQARLLMTKGNGVEQNFDEAMRLLHEAAELGNADAQWELGLKYEYGELGVEADAGRAFQLYRQSAEQDNAMGYHLVGHCYQHGISVEESHELSDQNYRRAFAMLQQLVAETNDRIALNFLGSAYFWGDGTERNREEGFNCYMRAAELGNPETQYKVGTCYLEGTGVTPDSVAALQWLNKAADQGYTAAIQKLENL